MRIDHLQPEDWAHHDPTLLQRLARAVITRPGRWLLRYRAYGHQPRVPAEGGFLLAPAPHGAFRDPFVFGLGQPRTRLRFMAKHQALRWPVVGRLIRWGGGFPVVRGGGRSADALEVARCVVDSGDGVVVFMEGRLELEHAGLGTPRDGLARLALATGAPVVPVAGHGTKRRVAYGQRRWRGFAPVTLCWGEPLRFPREEDPSPERVAEVRDEIWARVQELHRAAVHLATRPEGRPKHDSVNLAALLAELATEEAAA